MPSSLPTDSWNAPNNVFDDVALPDSATAIHPRTGASRTNAGPRAAKAEAKVFPMPA